jgi:hypothetical protein
MPFSKYVVDPAHVEAMRRAFYRICDALQLSGGVEDPMTELITMKIIDIAKTGELDSERICGRVLDDVGRRPETGK